MKPLLEILPGNINTGRSDLRCEISDDVFSFAIKNEEQNAYVAAAVYQFEKNDKSAAEDLKSLFSDHPFLKHSFAKTCLIFSNDESVLIPFNLYSSLENGNALNLAHGDITANDLIQTDLVTEAGVYNTYRISKPVSDFFAKSFPDAVRTHLYSALIKTPQPGDSISLIFYPDRFALKLNVKYKTQLIHTFRYAVPADVSYTLLNICQRFNLQNIPVIISGLIDRDSALYKEIYQYFETVDFAVLPEAYNYPDAIKEQPAHYFSHLFALVSCE
ncbi:MAG TPA: DUF3822 family protein [Chitinophagaceae bacterium]|nr:DUF3822 family protein [Chitinophagaceae bacterium]